MLLSVGDKLDHYQILDWCHYGERHSASYRTQNDSQHAGSTRRTLAERKSSMPFISPKHNFQRSGTKRNGSLSAHLPEDPPKGQIIESVNYAHENGIDKK
jgi:hypothetical protein